MLDIATEREHLVKAERDVAEGEERCRLQGELIDRLRAGGHSLVQAESLLETLQQTLNAWSHHRNEILRTIARLEAGQL